MNGSFHSVGRVLRGCLPVVGLTIALSTGAAGQGPGRHHGLSIGLYGIHLESSYGEGVSSAGGIGVEVAYAPSLFVAPYLAGSAISAGLGSGGWRTFEAGAAGRLPVGRALMLHAAIALGRRASSSFPEYGFVAWGGGIDVFVFRRLALHGRVDVVVPSGDPPGYRRDRVGLTLYLGR